MATALNFTKNENGHWVAEFLSSGDPMAVQVNRSKDGYLIINGSIDGLDAVTMRNLGPAAPANILVEIDVPEDVTISIVSYTEVTSAKVTGI